MLVDEMYHDNMVLHDDHDQVHHDYAYDNDYNLIQHGYDSDCVWEPYDNAGHDV